MSNTFHNPIVATGADPSVVYYNGSYYLVQSDGDIWVTRSRTLTGLGSGERVRVWQHPDSGPYTREVWAPEMVQIDGRFFVYFAADDGRNENHRMYVLESDTTDPQGPYTFHGKIAAPTDRWAIDGVAFQHGGALYFVWSGWEGTENVDQRLYIAPMSNPWTISGERVQISAPTEAWERRCGPPYINEGPEVLQRNRRVFMIYSASGSWCDEYCLGMLTADEGANLLDPASWRKSDGPVFAKQDTACGPGHNGFTTSPDGSEDWIVYHANAVSGTGWAGRSIRAQPFTWAADGTPVFGAPVAITDAVPLPSGETYD
ncbi:MAG TPA: glycoside hydrolase family 43 protein [Roseiflexaceae bacterium]|jgi:GH43 family beta-xylosidase|nr:glycoside hydrolase family 43 protein [Roseiflexaceae bacterium]